ncbi:MAG: hypothetical protein PV344_06725 [Anaplasma sp.]|nr:hypothetical protein [Anaplasma sp.]
MSTLRKLHSIRENYNPQIISILSCGPIRENLSPRKLSRLQYRFHR